MYSPASTVDASLSIITRPKSQKDLDSSVRPSQTKAIVKVTMGNCTMQEVQSNKILHLSKPYSAFHPSIHTNLQSRSDLRQATRAERYYQKLISLFKVLTLWKSRAQCPLKLDPSTSSARYERSRFVMRACREQLRTLLEKENYSGGSTHTSF